MVCAVIHRSDEGTVVHTELFDHLGNARNVIITATDEGQQRFPGVLAQDADPSELGSFLFEVRVLRRPLRIEICQVRGEVEVVFDQIDGCVIVVF